MDDGIDLTNVAKKLITQAFALTRPFSPNRRCQQTPSVWPLCFWWDQISQNIKAFILNWHNADIWLNGAERIVFRLNDSAVNTEDGFSHIG